MRPGSVSTLLAWNPQHLVPYLVNSEHAMNVGWMVGWKRKWQIDGSLFPSCRDPFGGKCYSTISFKCFYFSSFLLKVTIHTADITNSCSGGYPPMWQNYAQTCSCWWTRYPPTLYLSGLSTGADGVLSIQMWLTADIWNKFDKIVRFEAMNFVLYSVT